ncbi:MAG: zf-HC2 domain-containing protein, partial [Alicyclobacillaceae bacterium]|nr:zf-HC2 domain-containing protein [Alicyclobacillaceae bacterium]
MTCDPFQLQAYLDGELDAEAEEKVRRHLSACVACRRELSALKLLWSELDRIPEMESAPELPYLRHRVIAAVRNRGPARKKPSGRNPAFLWLDAQVLAWKPVLAGIQYVPVLRLLSRPSGT